MRTVRTELCSMSVMITIAQQAVPIAQIVPLLIFKSAEKLAENIELESKSSRLPTEDTVFGATAASTLTKSSLSTPVRSSLKMNVIVV